MNFSVSQYHHDEVHRRIITLLQILSALSNDWSKVCWTHHLNLVHSLLVSRKNVFNSSYMRICCITVEREAVTDFCSSHKSRDSSEAEERILSIRIILIQNLSHWCKTVYVLVFRISNVVQWGRIAGSTVWICEINRADQTNFEASFYVFGETRDNFALTFYNFKFSKWLTGCRWTHFNSLTSIF